MSYACSVLKPLSHCWLDNDVCVTLFWCHVTGKEQTDLDEILRELLGEAHASNTTTTTTKQVTSHNAGAVSDDAFTRERQEFTNPDGSTTTIERRKYKAPNVTENVTINKVCPMSHHPARIQHG